MPPSYPGQAGKSFLRFTEQLAATEQDIPVPEDNSPDRYRTNTKPQVRVYRDKARNRSRSHSHH
jgi:hypothetical protein